MIRFRCLLALALSVGVIASADDVVWFSPEGGGLEVKIGPIEIDGSDPSQVARRFTEVVLMGFVEEYQRRMPVAVTRGLGAWVRPWLGGDLVERLAADAEEVIASATDTRGSPVVEILSREEIAGGRQRVLLQVGWTSEGEEVVPPLRLYRIELARTFDEWRVVELSVPCPRCRGEGQCVHPGIAPPASVSDCPYCEGSGICTDCQGSGFRAAGSIGFPIVEEPPGDLPEIDDSTPESLVSSYWRAAPRARATVEVRILVGLAAAYQELLAPFLEPSLFRSEMVVGRERGRAVFERSRLGPPVLKLGERRLRPGGRIEIPGFRGKEPSPRIPSDVRFQIRRTTEGWRLMEVALRCSQCAGRGKCELCEGTGRRVGGASCERCEAGGDCQKCLGKGYRSDLLF